jgi:predicted branched-subunit amino acid permease
LTLYYAASFVDVFKELSMRKKINVKLILVLSDKQFSLLVNNVLSRKPQRASRFPLVARSIRSKS